MLTFHSLNPMNIYNFLPSPHTYIPGSGDLPFHHIQDTDFHDYIHS